MVHGQLNSHKMKNNKNINNKIYILLAMLLILGISFVSAFSVSSPYMENQTLNLAQNSKTTDLQFVLQNGGGATENVNIRVEILGGSEIANLTDESNIYTVIPGEKVPVNLRITLPKGVARGDIYNVKLGFTTVSVGQNGEFGFGTGQEQNFKVLVGEKIVPEKQYNSTYLFLIIGILLVALIIVALMIRRKNKIHSKKK